MQVGFDIVTSTNCKSQLQLGFTWRQHRVFSLPVACGILSTYRCSALDKSQDNSVSEAEDVSHLLLPSAKLLQPGRLA